MLTSTRPKQARSELAHGTGHHPPDLAAVLGVDLHRRVVGDPGSVFGSQLAALAALEQALHVQLAVVDGNHRDEVHTTAMYAKVRRLRYRDSLAISEIARRTSLSRNTVKTWLRELLGVSCGLWPGGSCARAAKH